MTQPNHLTLGELIERLRAEPNQAKRVRVGLAEPHSYRGYYDQLAFEPTPNVTVAEMLAAAESALGATFQGYKGGDYVMREYTDTWIAHWGESGGETVGALLLDRMLADVVGPLVIGVGVVPDAEFVERFHAAMAQPRRSTVLPPSAYERGIFDAGVAEGRRQATEGAVVEHALGYKSGDMQVRASGPDIEEVYPTAKWISNSQRLGAKVYTRTVIVVDDWAEVPRVEQDGDDRA